MEILPIGSMLLSGLLMGNWWLLEEGMTWYRFGMRRVERHTPSIVDTLLE
jgi:hypothetical protein